MRTMSPVTTASALSRGRGDCVSAAAAGADRIPRSDRAAMSVRIMASPQRSRLDVADSIWSAAVMTLEFIS